MFSLPWPAEEGSDRGALVGTRCPARVSPSRQLLCFSDSCPNPTACFRADFFLGGGSKKRNNVQCISCEHLMDLFRAKLPAQYSHIRNWDF